MPREVESFEHHGGATRDGYAEGVWFRKVKGLLVGKLRVVCEGSSARMMITGDVPDHHVERVRGVLVAAGVEHVAVRRGGPR